MYFWLLLQIYPRLNTDFVLQGHIYSLQMPSNQQPLDKTKNLSLYIYIFIYYYLIICFMY